MVTRMVKVCVLGDSNVGKSSITLRFVENRFDEQMANTIGAAFKSRYWSTEHGTTFKLQIWDTAGQERYKSLAPMYYRGAAVVLVVFDITRETSLESVRYWMSELRENGPADAVIALVGNKLDLAPQKREVPVAEGQRFAKEFKSIYCETSAKSGENVEKIFKDVCNFLEDRSATDSSNIFFNSGRRPINVQDRSVTGSPSRRGHDRPSGCCS